MFINRNIALHTTKVVLIPYCQHHVPTYHDWMKNPDIQAATASEPLSLHEEYSMQKSWQTDSDKLTFIICLPQATSSPASDHAAEIAAMIGDVNMFISSHQRDDGTLILVGELELMIATRDFQHKGYGRAALLCFLRYIIQHDLEIVDQFRSSNADSLSRPTKLDYLAAKIGEVNMKSLNLFESLGFKKTEAAPNYFGEFELRHSGMSVESVKDLMQTYDIQNYSEQEYLSSTNAEKTAVG